MAENKIIPMYYKVVEGEIKVVNKIGSPNHGKEYVSLKLVPQDRNRANMTEERTIVSFSQWDVENIEKYLDLLANDAKIPSTYKGIYTDIAGSLQLVENLPPFRLRSRDGASFGDVRTSMKVLVLLETDGTLSENPSDAVRRIINMRGRWETDLTDNSTSNVAGPIVDDLPEDDAWEAHPTKPELEINTETGEIRKK